MATNTTNYDLIKPEYADAADIADINSNMDVIDDAMNDNATAISSANTAIEANTQAIATNTQNIATNTAAITANSDAIAKKVNIEQKNVSDLNTLQTAGQLGIPLMSTWDVNVLNNPSPALGSGDGVCLGVGWGNYGTQIAVGRANGTPVTRTYSNGTWYGWEKVARMPKYTAVASGQYTTASWAYGTSTCTWTASEVGLYLVWIKYELADTSATNRNAYKQLQMSGTATRLLDSTLYYDAGISDGSAFASRTISQPVYVSSAGQTITPYVHTGTAGIVFNVKIIGVKIAD